MSRESAVSPKGGSTPGKKPGSRAKAKPRLAAVKADTPVPVDPESTPLRLVAPDPGSARLSPEVRRNRMRKALAAGLILACVGGGVVGVAKVIGDHGHRLHAVGPAPVVPAASAVTGPAVEAKPILADYRPPDRDEVLRAYVNVAAVYHGEGLSGVVRQTMDCFSGLEQTPSYPTLDYCIALDAYGVALQQKLVGDQAPGPESYFGGAGARELKAAQKVVANDGDPGARVLDVRRIAGEVSQAGPAAARLAIAQAQATALPPPVAGAADADPRAPVTVAAAEAPPPHVTTAAVPHTAPVAAPAPPARPVLARAAPAPAVVQARPQTVRVSAPAHAKPPKIAEPAPRAAPRAHLERASTPKPRPQPEPRLTKVSTRVAHTPRPEPRWAPEPRLTRTSARQNSQPHRSPLLKPPGRVSHDTFDPRRIMASIRSRFAPHPAKATHASTPVHKAPQHPLRIAARERDRYSDHNRYDVVDRRASEPSTWVDCRHPRSSSELRMCESDSGGDGTLDGQSRHGRGRYR